MEFYTLKEKIEVNEEFLEMLIAKGWQEVDQLQNQIANIQVDKNSDLLKIFNNLLTSYYVFIGGLENLSRQTNVAIIKNEMPVQAKPQIDELAQTASETTQTEFASDESNEDIFEDEIVFNDEATSDFEPFEYFVDFDEPTGEPISDEDLYGN